MHTLPSGDARNFKRSRSDASDAWAANAASAVYFYTWKKSRRKRQTLIRSLVLWILMKLCLKSALSSVSSFWTYMEWLLLNSNAKKLSDLNVIMSSEKNTIKSLNFLTIRKFMPFTTKKAQKFTLKYMIVFNLMK